MTPKQIEIGDKLLELLVEKHGRSGRQEYIYLLSEDGYDYRQDIMTTIQRLEDKGLVRPSKDGYFLLLTDEGYDVAKTGITAYFQQKNDRDDLGRQNLELQNEALQYQQKLRTQDEKIKRLTAANLQLQNKNLKRTILYMILSAIVGAVLSNLPQISKILQDYLQSTT